MENNISVKFLKVFLLLVISFIMICIPSFVRAQSVTDLKEWKPNSTELADVYEGKVVLRYPGTIRTLYIFEKPSKAIVRKIVDIPAENRMLYNIATGRMEPVLSPASSKTDDFVGTYTQKGNKIRIVVSSATIEATIVKNGLEGVLTWSDGDKEDWVVMKISNNAETNSTTSRNENSAYQNSTRNTSSKNKYSAPDDSPLIGTWKYQDGCKTEVDFLGNNSTTCKQVSTFTYSTNGHYQILVGGYLLFPKTFIGNWKYTVENKSSGTLEYFENDKLMEKGNVKFLDKSRFQYTITFSNYNSNTIGYTYVLNKQ